MDRAVGHRVANEGLDSDLCSTDMARMPTAQHSLCAGVCVTLLDGKSAAAVHLEAGLCGLD